MLSPALTKSRPRAVLGAAIAAVAWSVVASPALATYPGHNGRLLFGVVGPAGRGGPTTLATIAPDGSDPQPLRGGSDPVWRPDGRRFDFTLPYGGGPARGATLDADGTGLRKTRSLIAPGHRPVSAFSFSPTGRRIAFSVRLPHAEGDGWAVYVSRPDGTRMRRVLTTKGHYAYVDHLRWSPDGRTLIGIEGQQRLWLIPASGKGARVLVGPARDSRAMDPSWAPDGRTIYYALDPGPGPPGDTAVMAISPDGQDPQLIVDGAYLPVVSPDGTQLAYETRDGKLTVADRDGANAHVAFSGAIDSLDWQPLR
jgi:WD40 repeat protein